MGVREYMEKYHNDLHFLTALVIDPVNSTTPTITAHDGRMDRGRGGHGGC